MLILPLKIDTQNADKELTNWQQATQGGLNLKAALDPGPATQALQAIDKEIEETNKSANSFFDKYNKSRVKEVFGVLKGVLSDVGLEALGVSKEMNNLIDKVSDGAKQGALFGSAFGPIGGILGGVAGGLREVVTEGKKAIPIFEELKAKGGVDFTDPLAGGWATFTAFLKEGPEGVQKLYDANKKLIQQGLEAKAALGKSTGEPSRDYIISNHLYDDPTMLSEEQKIELNRQQNAAKKREDEEKAAVEAAKKKGKAAAAAEYQAFRDQQQEDIKKGLENVDRYFQEQAEIQEQAARNFESAASQSKREQLAAEQEYAEDMLRLQRETAESAKLVWLNYQIEVSRIKAEDPFEKMKIEQIIAANENWAARSTFVAEKILDMTNFNREQALGAAEAINSMTNITVNALEHQAVAGINQFWDAFANGEKRSKADRRAAIAAFTRDLGSQLMADGLGHMVAGTAALFGGNPIRKIEAPAEIAAGAAEFGVGVGMGGVGALAQRRQGGTEGHSGASGRGEDSAPSSRITDPGPTQNQAPIVINMGNNNVYAGNSEREKQRMAEILEDILKSRK